MEKRKYKITGMFCAACVRRVETAAKKATGVSEASVSLLTNSLSVTFKDSVDDKSVISQVEKAGYGASIDYGETIDAKRKERNKRLRGQLIKLIVTAVLSLILMYFAMGPMWGWPSFSTFVDETIELGLATIIIGIYYPYFIHGFRALFTFHPTMESLIALGSSVSYIYSVIIYALTIAENNFLTQNVYFDGAAMILVLVSLGKYLEALAKSRTTASLENILSLAPSTALVEESGSEKEKPIAQLRLGDICVIKPGAKIPTDGTIVSGYGHLEEAAITGESAPVYKKIGDSVLTGSINLVGSFRMKATAVGKDNAVNRIGALVEEAASSKGKLSGLADRVSSVFVPFVIIAAIITFISWFFYSRNLSLSITFGVSVLVVACPCALGLATPVAVMVGAGRGAEHGILVKSASAFEDLSRCTALVFDKTGTLTTAHLKVLTYHPIKESTETLNGLYSLESASEHPLAWSIALYLENIGAVKLPYDSFVNEPGYGISGKINGHRYVIGNKDMLDKKNISIFPIGQNDYESKGASITYFAIDDSFAGFFASSDELKPDAKAAIHAFEATGIGLYLASGDSAPRAEALAKSVGINHVFSSQKPGDKDKLIASLQKNGDVVAMIGDGVNDAPALAKADIGIAIGTGTDLAIDSADIVLMSGSLHDLAAAFYLSKKVTSNIKTNLFWAFFYNAVGIPLAAGALHYVGYDLSPMLASLMMALSSVCVVLNALRLRSVKLGPKD